jgi:hypothetical protein
MAPFRLTLAPPQTDRYALLRAGWKIPSAGAGLPGSPTADGAVTRSVTVRRTSDDGVGEHRPAAGHEVVLVRVVQGPPAIALVRRPVPGRLVLPEPGPPPLPVLFVPGLSFPLQVGGSGGLGDGVQASITAAPAAAAALGEPVLGQGPQRGRCRRGAQPGGGGRPTMERPRAIAS